MTYITYSLLVLLCFMVSSAAPACFDSDPKTVVAHFMVGNTYSYTPSDWAEQISIASSKGIDGFALNIGNDDWQQGQVADAFAAAAPTTFKLFFSFDMSSFPCQAASDAAPMMYYINTYSTHQSTWRSDGKMVVSTFSGENCRFGAGSLNQAWTNALKTGPSTCFMPAFFVDPSTFNTLPVMDGAFSWNAGWPMGDYDVNTDSDNSYIQNLQGRAYMASVSPWFFTHYGPNSYNKNFIYRSDDWLMATRWEQLFQLRSSITIAQIVTWNDYGESHYIGPIAGDLPNSGAWTDGYDHQGWLGLVAYYITAFKTGSWPSIDSDQVFVWGRRYPAGADAPDSVGRPSNWQWTGDFLWAVVLLSAPADVTLSCGSSSSTTTLQQGLWKLKLPMTDEGQVRAEILRGGIVVLVYEPDGFTFQLNPPSYNFNAFVGASP